MNPVQQNNYMREGVNQEIAFGLGNSRATGSAAMC